MTTVGAFTYADGTVTGPAEYMDERGEARLAKMLAGEDTVFNAGVRFHGGDTATLVLVSLQTDFAAWKGMRELKGASS